MRHFLTTSLIIFAITSFMYAPTAFADPSGFTDGQSCDSGAGAGSGRWQNNQCVPADTYVTQSGGVNSGTGGTRLINPLQSGASLESFLISILNFVIRIGTVVVILMLVYVGYLFVVARGNPGEIETAKKALLWTLIGALILLGSKAIAIGIEQTVQALSVGR